MSGIYERWNFCGSKKNKTLGICFRGFQKWMYFAGVNFYSWKNDNDVTGCRHEIILKLFWRCFGFLVKVSYWSKFHVNITTGSRVITIFFYKGWLEIPPVPPTHIMVKVAFCPIKKLGFHFWLIWKSIYYWFYKNFVEGVTDIYSKNHVILAV